MKTFRSSLLIVVCFALVLGFGAGCASDQTSTGGKRWSIPGFSLSIAPPYAVLLSNNSAPVMRVEKDGAVFAEALPLGESVRIPYHMFEAKQSNIKVTGYKVSPDGAKIYVGMRSYVVFPQDGGVTDSIVVDYLQVPRTSY